MHAELAVSLAHDADRVLDLGLVHSVAVLVPAARGDWELASAHVRMATEAVQRVITRQDRPGCRCGQGWRSSTRFGRAVVLAVILLARVRCRGSRARP